MRIVHSIHIEAAPEIVWQVTEDVERWPEWTPTVTSVRRVSAGALRLGSVARIKQPAQRAAEWTVTEFERGRRFAWETRRAGLLMRGTHEILQEPGGARNRLGLEASGPLVALLWPILWLATRRAMAAENRGLKARAESVARGRAT